MQGPGAIYKSVDQTDINFPFSFEFSRSPPLLYFGQSFFSYSSCPTLLVQADFSTCSCLLHLACQALMEVSCNRLLSTVKWIKLALQRYTVVARGYFAVLLLVIGTCLESTWRFSSFARLLLVDGDLHFSFLPPFTLPLCSVQSLRRLRVWDTPFDVAVP